MITEFIIFVATELLNFIFGWLPSVSTLPTIGGYDIDTALVNGVGQLREFFNAFWPLELMFNGFLFLMVYYSLKLLLRFFLGGRAPAVD